MYIEVHLENGAVAYTEFNGSIADARKYYINQTFNMGTFEIVNMIKCTHIKIHGISYDC